MEGAEVLIGRDPEKCQVVLGDPQVSSVHASVTRAGSVVTLADLGSSNGTILNGKRVNKGDLASGDEFVVGSTTFTFRVTASFLQEEEEGLMPVEEGQSVEVEKVIEVDEEFADAGEAPADAGPSSQSLFSKEALRDPERRKKLLMIGVALMGLWVLLDEGEEVPTAPPAGARREAGASPGGGGAGPTAGGPEGAAGRGVSSKDAARDKPLDPDKVEFLDSQYLLVKELFDQGKFQETLLELEKLFQVADEWKEARQIETLSLEGLARIEEQERRRREEEERRRLSLKVKGVLVKARKAVEERKAELAEALFGEILKLEPDNFDVIHLRMELDNWKREQERKRLEEAAAKAERDRRVALLAPGKEGFLRKRWYGAVLRLEKFLKIKEMDEDLTKEAVAMLETSRKELAALTGPLLSKARSLKEGQDLKGAHEHYSMVLKHDPGDEESLNEVSRIKDVLENRARNVFIEGLIAENLSLFREAREKFQEVQEISLAESGYYRKASDKLRNYFE